MKEISLHILDLIENSVAAGAQRVDVVVAEDLAADRLRVVVQDDGKGMATDLARSATDPFTTTRSTRKVGMGIPLLSAAAEQAGGSFSLRSKPGRGTTISAEFQLSHIDRAPLGRIDETIATAAVLHPELDLRLRHRVGRRHYRIHTRSIDSSAGPASVARAIRDKVAAGRERVSSRA